MLDFDALLEQFYLDPNGSVAASLVKMLLQSDRELDINTANQVLHAYITGNFDIPYQTEEIKGEHGEVRVVHLIPINKISTRTRNKIRGSREFYLLDSGVRDTHSPSNFKILLRSLPQIVVANQDVILDSIKNTITDFSNKEESYNIETSPTRRDAIYENTMDIQYRQYQGKRPIKLELTLRRAVARDFLEFRIMENIAWKDMHGERHETLGMALSGPYAHGDLDENDDPGHPEWDKFDTLEEMQKLIQEYLQEVRGMSL